MSATSHIPIIKENKFAINYINIHYSLEKPCSLTVIVQNLFWFMDFPKCTVNFFTVNFSSLTVNLFLVIFLLLLDFDWFIYYTEKFASNPSFHHRTSTFITLGSSANLYWSVILLNRL